MLEKYRVENPLTEYDTNNNEILVLITKRYKKILFITCLNNLLEKFTFGHRT